MVVKSKQLNVRAPADHIAAFRTQSEAESLSMMDWVLQCCLANMTAVERGQLSERKSRPPRPTGKPPRSGTEYRFDLKVPEDWLIVTVMFISTLV